MSQVLVVTGETGDEGAPASLARSCGARNGSLARFSMNGVVAGWPPRPKPRSGCESFARTATGAHKHQHPDAVMGACSRNGSRNGDQTGKRREEGSSRGGGRGRTDGPDVLPGHAPALVSPPQAEEDDERGCACCDRRGAHGYSRYRARIECAVVLVDTLVHA